MSKKWFAGALTGAIALGGIFPVTPPLQAQPLKQVDRSTRDRVSDAPNLEQQYSLLDAGVEPRQPLRFAPQVNEKQTTTITLQTSVAMTVGEQVVPSMEAPASTMTFESTITQVDDNGDIHYQMSCTGIEVADSPNAPPQVRELLEAQLKTMVGAGGTFVMDSQGNVKESDFKLPDNADAMMQQIFDQVSQSFEQLSTPFPTEAVGLGAKWQIAQTMNVGGMQMTQNTVYELVSLQDNIATFNINLEQQAPSQQIAPPGLPPGAQVTLNSMASQGEGQVILRLDRLMPESGTLSMQSQTDLKIFQEGMPQEMPMTSTMTMQMNWRSQ